MVAEICRYSVSGNKNLSADTPVFNQSEFRIWFGLGLSNQEPGTTELVVPVHMKTSFWYGKGDIPNEKIRLPPLEVHFGVGGCGRTNSEWGAGQE